MPGRTPADAYRAFIGPVERAFSCLGQTKVTVSAGGRAVPNADHAWTLNDGRGFTVQGWHFEATMNYRIVPSERAAWRVTTRGYQYRLSRTGEDVFRLHWHPFGPRRTG